MVVLRKISDGIHVVEKVIVSIALGVIFIVLALSVILRYFFNSPLEWSGELAVFLLAWTTFIGASMTIKRQQSAAVSIFVEKMPEPIRNIFELFIPFFVFVFSLFIFITSIYWLSSPNLIFQLSLAMNIPMFIPYLSIPIGFLFMTYHAGVLFLDRCMEFRKGAV